MTRIPTPVGKSICPTPLKVRYTSRREAKKGAAIQSQSAGQEIYFYDCACGFYHLTRSQPRKVDADIPTVIGIPHALALSNDEFTALVDFDIHGRLTEEESEILRHPDVVQRWIYSLGVLRTAAEADLARINAMVKTPATLGRRDAKIKYIVAIERLQQAAKSTRRDVLPRAPKPTNERKVMRRTAGDRALEALTNRHRHEFTRLFYREAELLGLELTLTLEEALERLDLEALRELHPAGPEHEEGTPRYPDVHVVLMGHETFYEIAGLVTGAVFRHLRDGDQDVEAAHAVMDIVGGLQRMTERSVTDALYILRDWVTIHLPFTAS